MTIGVLVAFGGVALLGLMGFCVAWSLSNKQKEKNKKCKEDKSLSVYYSSEALWEKDKVLHELEGLISDIAEHQAKKAGKLATLAEARRGLPKEKLISSEDMDAAFLEAMKELNAEISIINSCCVNACDKESLLQKIQKLCEKYEKQTP